MMLVERFDRAVKKGSGLRGALLGIDQTPYKVADYFKKSSGWPDRSTRAQKVLNLFSDEDRKAWKALARENAQTATTLRKLGKQRSAKLVYHGYVLAMANLHIILNYPLLPIPSLEKFEKLAS